MKKKKGALEEKILRLEARQIAAAVNPLVSVSQAKDISEQHAALITWLPNSETELVGYPVRKRSKASLYVALCIITAFLFGMCIGKYPEMKERFDDWLNRPSDQQIKEYYNRVGY